MVEIERLKKDILDLLMPYLVERAGRIYIESEEYKESTKAADLVFEELNETLTDEQQELFEPFYLAFKRWGILRIFTKLVLGLNSL